MYICKKCVFCKAKMFKGVPAVLHVNLLKILYFPANFGQVLPPSLCRQGGLAYCCCLSQMTSLTCIYVVSVREGHA